MPPEQQPPETQSPTPVTNQDTTVYTQPTVMPPQKSNSHLVLWLVLGGSAVLVIGTVALLLVGFFVFRKESSVVSSTGIPTEKVITDTPCYTIETTGLDAVPYGCDLKTLVDNGGYFPGIEILTYQENTYETFEEFKKEYEKELRADSTLENITSKIVNIDGLEAVRYEYQLKQSDNVSEVYIGADEGFRPTYYEIWVDVEGELAYIPNSGGTVKAFSIKGSNSTQSTELTFNRSLESIRWIKS